MIFANPLFWAVILVFVAVSMHWSRASREQQAQLSPKMDLAFEAPEPPQYSIEDADRELSEKIEAAAKRKGIRVDV